MYRPFHRHTPVEKPVVSATQDTTLTHRFDRIRERLLDTETVLPSVFNGVVIDYPSPQLALHDELGVRLSTAKSSFSAFVTELETHEDALRVVISIDAPDFAVAALSVFASPDHRAPELKTTTVGQIDIIKHHAPVPGLVVRAAAKRAISSFLGKVEANLTQPGTYR